VNIVVLKALKEGEIREGISAFRERRREKAQAELKNSANKNAMGRGNSLFPPWVCSGGA